MCVDQKSQCAVCYREFLQAYAKNVEELFDSIYMGDETIFTTETKEIDRQWLHTTSPSIS